MKRIAIVLCLLAAACSNDPDRALRKQVDALYDHLSLEEKEIGRAHV